MRVSKAAITKTQAIFVAVIVIVAVAAGSYYYYQMTAPKPFITLATWGGIWTEAFNDAIESFEQEYGIEVKIYTQGSSMETLGKIRAEKESPTIDLFFGGGHTTHLGSKEGLFAAIDKEKVPNLKYIDPNFIISPDQVLFGLWGSGWMIRPDIIPEELAFDGTPEWFFDPRLEDKLAVPTPKWSMFIEWISIIAGDYYDWKGGIELTKKLTPNIKVVYSSSPEVEALFAGEEIYAAMGLFADAKSMSEKGIPVETLKFYPLIASSDNLVIVKGSKEDLAMKFLNHAFTPKWHASICYTLGGVTSNLEAPTPPSELEPYAPVPTELVTVSDYDQIGEHTEDWIEAWEREITPLLG